MRRIPNIQALEIFPLECNKAFELLFSEQINLRLSAATELGLKIAQDWTRNLNAGT